MLLILYAHEHKEKEIMKKLLVIMFVLISVGAYAIVGFIEKEWIEGSNKYYKYSNGVIITIASHKLCPISIK